MFKPGMESVSGERIRSSERTCQARDAKAEILSMIPFKVDPSWYERYWWSDPAPDRTACRADKADRERLLRAAGAMKVAINLLDRIVWTALTQRPRLGSRYRVDRSAWSWPAGSDLGGRGEPMRPGIF